MEHDWLKVRTRNGDEGYVCLRCWIAAIHLPVPKSLEDCPFTPVTQRGREGQVDE